VINGPWTTPGSISIAPSSGNIYISDMGGAKSVYKLTSKTGTPNALPAPTGGWGIPNGIVGSC
jgi:DNA-binding beta-propeller fold protein YncE